MGVYDLLGNVSEWTLGCKPAATDKNGHCLAHLFSGTSGHAIIHTLGPPADIAVDTKRNRVAVPVVAMNHVEIYELPK